VKAVAAVVRATGGPEAIELETIEIGAPGPREVLIRHTAIGVNFIDVYQRSGLYSIPLPARLGNEAAGVVEAVGSEVTSLRVGDRVGYATAGSGAYATARLAPADRVIKLPDAISDDVAAAAMLKGMTAEYLIRRTYALKAGETVLFHAAAGGVGLIASQWLAHLGATVIGTVGSPEKGELARAHGVAHAIDYTREDFVARVKELTNGRGVPVAYDAVGKTTFEKTLDCLAPRGLAVSFGNASGKPPPIDLLTLSAKGSLYVTRPTLHQYTHTRAELEASATALFDVIASGAVKVEARQRFPLTRAGEAHRALEARKTTGSILLVP
jgi:NADPH2:quinone reductase